MKVLFIRLGAAGDIIHSLPALTTLRCAQPDWEIHWLVKPGFATLLADDTRITRLWLLPRNNPIRDFKTWKSLLDDLRQQRFDVVIDLQGLIKSALLAAFSGARRCIGFQQTREYTACFYSERYPRRGRHVSQMNASLVADAFPGLRIVSQAGLCVTEEGLTFGREWFTTRGGESPRLLVNVGGGWPTKRYPPEMLAEALELASARTGIRQYHILWGPGEEELARSACGPHGVIIPDNNFKQMLGLLHEADIVVSGDTAPLHAAAAFNKVCVGIFGPTDPERNGAGSALGTVVYNNCHCRNCFKRSCNDWICMPQLTPERVADAIEGAFQIWQKNSLTMAGAGA